MKIKTTLLLYIGGALVLLLSLTFFLLITLTSNKVTAGIDSQLSNQTDSITDQVSLLLNSTARGYLMSQSSNVNSTLDNYYNLYKDNNLNLDNLNSLIKETIDDIKFLQSGYVFLTDPDGIIINQIDKSKIETNPELSKWLLSLIPSDKSFYTYTENNRNKIIYRVFNKNLQVNICATAYISDFIRVVDPEELNNTMNNIKIGKTGYAFLIKKGGAIVSHPSPGLIFTNISNINDSKGNPIYNDILNSLEGNYIHSWAESDGTFKDKFSNFRYEPNSELTIATTGYIEEFYETVDDIERIILFSAIIIIAVLFFIIVLVSTTVVKPINYFNKNLREISEGNGDLTKRINIKTKSEIGTMAHIFNGFLNTLQNIIIEIKKSALETVIIKDEITADIEETSAALYEISTNIQSIDSRTNKLNNDVKLSSNSIDKIDKSIVELNNSVENQSSMLQTSTAAITEMISSINNVSKITSTKQSSASELIKRAESGANIIDETLTAVEEVNNQISNIKAMANVISEIASQTNLLAMNAAIEAAHAGDAGKGFAVVADEIRKLAETSDSNSKEITLTLSNIQNSIIQADTLSKKTRESFSMVNSEINEIVGALEEINNSTNELQIGGKDILESITGLEQASSIVQDRALSIQRESKDIQIVMTTTGDITMEVVNAIEEIGQGSSGISDSMDRVTTTSSKLRKTGDNLKKNVDRFITD